MSVVDRILSVSWLVIPVGALVATAVYSFVSWRTAQDDIVYRQAVAWHGKWRLVHTAVYRLGCAYMRQAALQGLL